MLKTCPDPVEVQDIQFKLHCRLKIFDNTSIETFQYKPSLISCASRYGLLFAGSDSSNLHVIPLKCIENYSPKDKDITNYPRRNVPLPSGAFHVSINCDSTILAVVVEKEKCPTVIFYDVPSFYKQNVDIIKEIRLSATPGINIVEIGWNPALPPIFTACKNDGSLGVYEIKGDSIDINEIPSAAEASCFCWSPKGKQIAVGTNSGKITQYKPDLKPVKVTNAPPLDGKQSLISLQWISNYQFIGVYQASQEDGQLKLIVIDAPKTGECTYTNYDDVCYGGTGRAPQFFMILQQHWNLLLVASSNSSELAALGIVDNMWKQLIVGDASRAELPLNAGDDTYPIGLTLDIGNTKPLPWGESTIPPCPYVIMLSHAGVLCIFDIVNLKEGIPTICTPPDSISDMSGLGQFVTESPKILEKKSSPAISTPTPQMPLSSTVLNMTTPSKSLFGQPANVQDSSKPLFSPAQPPIASFSQAATSVASLNSKPSSQSVSFGQLTTTTKSVQFGVQQPQVTTTTTSLFGTTKTSSTSQFTFGGKGLMSAQPSTSGQASTNAPSLFASQTATTIQSPFGSAKQQICVGTTNTFASQSPFGNLTTPSTAQSLFGGQTTLTSVKPNPTSTPPTSTITPSNKYNTILTALSNPAPTNLKTSKPAAVSFQPSLVPTTSTTSSVQNSEAFGAENKLETDNLIARMVKEECLALDSELKALLHQGKSINVNIGSEEEKIHLTSEIESLQEFIKEIVDVSLGENAEIHSLKQNLILSWAWYEEAQMHYNTSKDETMSLLLKSQPLDSATEKRQSDMRKLMYYIESQLMQANRALDEQWDTFQDYAKKTYRAERPTMESIFQTMVRQNAIIQKQCYILKDLSNRLKMKTRLLSGPPLLLSIENSLDLEEDLKKLRIDQVDSQRHLYDKALKQAKALTKSKVDHLRKHLKSREVVHISSIKPELSSSILQTPAAKEKLISILGAQMASANNKGLSRPLDFVQSTPIKNELMQTPPNTPAQVVTQNEFIYKTPERSTPGVSLANSAFQPFTSTSLNLVHDSKTSAFASTTPISKAFNFQTKPETHNIAVAKTTPLQLFNFGGGGSATTTAVTSKVESISSPFPSKPVAFGTSLSFTSASSQITTNKPFPVFGTSSSSKPSSTPSSQQFGSISSTSVTKSQETTQTTTANVSKPTVQFPTKPSTVFGTGGAPSSSFGSSVTTKDLLDKAVPTSFTGFSSFQPQSQNINSNSTKSVSVTSSSSSSKTLLPERSTSSTSSSSAETVKSIFGAQQSVATTSIAPIVSTSTLVLPSFNSTAPEAQVSESILTSSAPISATTNAVIVGNVTAPVTASATVPLSTAVLSNITTPTCTVVPYSATSTSLSNVTSPSASQPSVTSTALFFGTATSTGTSASIMSQNSTLPTAFASNTVTSSTASSSIFTTGSSTTSIFRSANNATPTSSTVQSASSGSSIFAPPKTVADTTPVFGSTLSSTASTSTSSEPVIGNSSIFSAPTATQANVFGAVSSNKSIFGSTATTSLPQTVFGTSTTQSSLFGNKSSTTTASSAFGGGGTTSSQGSIFGAQVSQSSIFGTPTTTTQSSVFGTPVTSQPSNFSTPNSTQSSVFGSPTTSQASAFGSATTTQSSVFGTATTTQSSVFGSATTTQSSVFGSATTTQSSVFGPATTTQSSVFGSATTTQSSIFGAAGMSASNTSIFGSPTTAPTSFTGGTSPFGQTSVFGTPKTTASAFGSPPFGSTSVFGSAPATTASVFGQPAAFGQNAGVFGTATTASSPFGSTGTSSTFGATSSSGNVFGAPAASSSFSFSGNSGSFGFGTLNVGNAATTSSSIFGGSAFGQATTVSNPFSRNETKSAFGSSGGSSIFGGGVASSSGSIFGSNTSSGFGASGFGSPSGFQTQTSTFGQPSTFGSPSQPGPFSGGGTGVGQTGFGSPTFQKPASGFGGAPVFGGSPQQAFGAAPTFGGSPAFGAAPSFGSPNKVFGSNTPTAAFGSSSGSPGFGNLANQNSIGFGNLAQQAATSTSSPFSGSSSFSTWR